MGLLKFIAITFLVLYVIRMILRMIFPVMLRSIFNNSQQQPQNQSRNQKAKPEGSISIDYMPPKPNSGNIDKLGDFVDYEEIK